jgi:hypothetical protein
MTGGEDTRGGRVFGEGAPARLSFTTTYLPVHR